MPEIELVTPATAAHIAVLHDHLVRAGKALPDEACGVFLLKVSGPGGAMTAGCKGEIAFRSAHVSELWVDQSQRGQGVGRDLLRAAEAFARDRGCLRVHLETRSDQARGLYESLGYRVFGKLPDYDGDQSFYYLEKRID